VTDLDVEVEQILAEPCPCDTCTFRPHCANMRLACQRFSTYVVGDRNWQGVPVKVPKRRWFLAVFEDAPRRGRDRVQRRSKKRPARPRSRASGSVGASSTMCAHR
jgi:hypothetical protein